MFGAGVDVQQRVEQRAHGQHQEQNGQRQRHVADKQDGGLAQVRHQVQAELDDQGRGHLRQAMEDLVMAQVIEPVQGRLPTEQFNGVEDEVARHASEQQGHRQQHQQAKAGMQQWVLIEGAPEVLGVEPELFDIHGGNRFFCKTRRGRLEHLSAIQLAFRTNALTKKQLINAVRVKTLGLDARNRYPMQLIFCISSR